MRGWAVARWLVGILLAVVYAPVLVQMARIWWTDTYAGHGLFVPLFSALLLWLDRERLRGTAGPGHPVGVLVIVLGLGMLGLGRWTGSVVLQSLSIVAAVAGMVLWAAGLPFLRRAAFPVFYLALMVPLPRPIVNATTLYLQLFAAGFAGRALDVFGIPSYLDGTLIVLPRISLDVAEVCNGLRFLMALVVLTLAFAQVLLRSPIRKAVLAVSAIPIAILANAVRVAAVAVAVEFIGPQAASGPIHNYIGKGVWILTLVPLAMLLVLLRRGDRRSGEPSAAPARAFRSIE